MVNKNEDIKYNRKRLADYIKETNKHISHQEIWLHKHIDDAIRIQRSFIDEIERIVQILEELQDDE